MTLDGLAVGGFIQPIQISAPHPFSFTRSGFRVFLWILFKSSTTRFSTEIITGALITDDESCIFCWHIHPAHRISYHAFVDPGGWFQASHFHPPFFSCCYSVNHLTSQIRYAFVRLTILILFVSCIYCEQIICHNVAITITA